MTTATGIYDLLEERQLTSERLPTEDELLKAVDAIDALAECLTGPVAQACIKVGNANEPGSVNFEQIARLVIWADRIRWSVEPILQNAEHVSIMAREVFPMIANGGDYPHGEIFTEYGSVVDAEYYGSLRRQYGFSNAS